MFPLTISDNESVDEVEVSRDEVQAKTDEESDPEGGVMSKKSHKTESSTGLKNRSVYDMLKNAADKKKEGQMKKKIQNPFNRKRGLTRRSLSLLKHWLKQKRI